MKSFQVLAIALTASVSGLLGPGCSQLVPLDLATDAQATALRDASAERIPVRLAVAPIALDYPTTITADAVRAPVKFREAPLREKIARMLGDPEMGVFARAEPIDPPTDADGDDLRAAADEGSDLLLRTRVRRAEVRFLGRNGWFVPNIFVWFWTLFPSWYVGDESYAGEMEVDWQVIAAGSEAVVASGTARVSEERRVANGDHDPEIFGAFRDPESIETAGWQALGEKFKPIIEPRLALTLDQQIGAALRPLKKSGALERSLAARHAVVVGLSRTQDAPIAGAESAEKDARAFAAMLARSGYPAKNVTVLIGAEATSAAITDALTRAAKRVRPRDSLVFYYAGAGSDGDAVGLAGFNARVEKAPSAGLVTFERLANIVSVGSARETIVLLDCGFHGVGPAGSRALFHEQIIEAGREADRSSVLQPLVGVKGLVVLAAASAYEGAHEVPGASSGIFTYHLLRGLAGAADTDHDGRITFAELARYLTAEMASTTGLLGVQQKPFFSGGEPAQVLPFRPAPGREGTRP